MEEKRADTKPLSFIGKNEIAQKAETAEATAPAQTEQAPAGKAPEGKAPEGYHANPLYIENKSKRLQLLTKPSTAEKLRAKAQREGRSVNDIVNTILEEAFREE